MSLTVDIVLDRFSKVYHEGDVLRGSVHVINAGIDTRFDSITITVEGTVTLQFGHRNAGPFEAFTSSAKTQSLLAANIVAIAPPGHITAGLNEFPFECALTMQRDPNRLFETYHGAFVAINYAVRCEVRPSAFLAKAITRTQTFCVQNRPLPALPAARDAEVNFSISPETMARTAKERIAIPRFLVTGKLDRSEWCVTRPITGQLTVQHTEMAVKSIELQLIRVETSGNAEGTPSDGDLLYCLLRYFQLNRFYLIFQTISDPNPDHTYRRRQRLSQTGSSHLHGAAPTVCLSGIEDEELQSW